MRRQVHRLAVGQPQRDHCPARAAAPCGARCAARSACVANTACTVSLNCRTLAKPAANATSVTGRSVVSSSTRAVCARCARASASGPGADLGDQRAVHLALGVAEPARQAGHAVAVDDAVGDQPQRAAGEIAADVPLRRAGRGVRTAPLARAEAGALGGGGAGVERRRCRAWA